METRTPSLEQLQEIAGSPSVLLPTLPATAERSNLLPGQIRPVFYVNEDGRWAKRYVMIVKQSDADSRLVGAMLIHTWPSLSTQDDVRVRPEDIAYPLDGSVQVTNQAPLLVAQLGPALAEIPDQLLQLVLGLNRGGKRDAARTGPLLLEEDDLRAQFAREEWTEMQVIAAEAFEFMSIDDEVSGEESLESRLVYVSETLGTHLARNFVEVVVDNGEPDLAALEALEDRCRKLKSQLEMLAA